jgi:hypothetical protein
MSNANIVNAILLPAGPNVEPYEVLIDDYKSIQTIIGGPFDCVRTDMGQPEKVALVGYVHDEGLLLNLDFNFLATALFKREIRGDIVVTWGLSDNGYYDGDNHDMPPFILKFLQETLLEETALAYNMSVMMESACNEIRDAGYGEIDDLVWAMEELEQNPTLSGGVSVAITRALMWGADNLEDEVLKEFCELVVQTGVFDHKKQEG